jgi:hypothetical protein
MARLNFRSFPVFGGIIPAVLVFIFLLASNVLAATSPFAGIYQGTSSGAGCTDGEFFAFVKEDGTFNLLASDAGDPEGFLYNFVKENISIGNDGSFSTSVDVVDGETTVTASIAGTFLGSNVSGSFSDTEGCMGNFSGGKISEIGNLFNSGGYYTGTLIGTTTFNGVLDGNLTGIVTMIIGADGSAHLVAEIDRDLVTNDVIDHFNEGGPLTVTGDGSFSATLSGVDYMGTLNTSTFTASGSFTGTFMDNGNAEVETGTFSLTRKIGLPLTSVSTWENIGPTNPAVSLFNIVWNGSQFVVVGDLGTIFSSPDGVAWTSRTSGTNDELFGLTWSPDLGLFVAVGGVDGVRGTILTSPDGITWTERAIGQHFNLLTSVIWANGQFVLTGGGGIISTSLNGITWTGRTSGTSNFLEGIVWNGSQYVVVGESGTILTSPDGELWADDPISGTTDELFKVAWDGTQFVAVGGVEGSHGTILTSPDGITWTPQTSGSPDLLLNITWNGTHFMSVGLSGTILSSTDGVTWTAEPSGTRVQLEGIDWDGNNFLVVGLNGTIFISPSIIQNDLIVDFGTGTGGLWAYLNDSTWKQLNALGVSILATGDIDESGKDDVVVVFPGLGTWVYIDNDHWEQVHPFDAEAVVIGDLNDQLGEDIILDFGPGIGLWVRYDNDDLTWTNLHAQSPELMAVGRLDGGGHRDLMVDFGASGLWVWMNDANWVSLHPFSATHITTADIDNNGQDDVIVDFGPGIGIWVYFNNNDWQPLHPLAAGAIATGDLDNNGEADVLVHFPGFGLWVYRNGTDWEQLHPFLPEIITTGNIDNDSRDEVIVDFGPGFGIWIFRNNTAWDGAPLHPLTADHLGAADIDGN